ncbi:MAG: hypothetical protein IPG67_01350 [Acidobacteria bacterium]|nr:hypothetical protein [Acidobacteriota bacterium]
MQHDSDALCPKCNSRDFKPWGELDHDELIAAEARPTKYTSAQRKKHRICTRCWFEQAESKTDLV